MNQTCGFLRDAPTEQLSKQDLGDSNSLRRYHWRREEGPSTMRLKQSKPMQRLIDSGICKPMDIEEARIYGATLTSSEYTQRIRRAEIVLGTIGEPNRIKIILLLSKREMCVCELESALRLPQPTVSHHLMLLEHAELVQRDKRKKWVFYKLRDSPVTDFLRSIVMGRSPSNYSVSRARSLH